MANEEVWLDELTTAERFTASSGDDAGRSTGDYRDYLLPHDHPTLIRLRGESVRDYAEDRLSTPMMRAVREDWAAKYAEPFVGVTDSGTLSPGLFGDTGASDQLARTAQMVDAARVALESLDADQRRKYRYVLDAPEWRAWSNPEILVYEVGLRLEEISQAQRAAILRLVEVSLSPSGYRTVIELMRLNGFLGELVDLPIVLNEFSYQVALFGDPSSGEPWGWQLFGHHIALNLLVVGDRMVLSPVFLGAEPNRRNDGSNVMFGHRQQLALELMAGLNEQQREQAQLYASVLSPDMPSGRIEPIQERHLAGAFQDNRVIPYEGIRSTELDKDQRALLIELLADHIDLLPGEVKRARLAEITSHLDDTWFCWIGGISMHSPFYFRIQSPVILVELDHHAGVWLTNQFPAIFHVHTTMRTPNGGDYGKALIGLHEDRSREAAQ